MVNHNSSSSDIELGQVVYKQTQPTPRGMCVFVSLICSACSEHTYLHTHMHPYIVHTRVHTYTHAYIHSTCIHIYLHTCVLT